MRTAICLAVALACVAPSTWARAQVMKDALRLNIATPLFEYSYGKQVREIGIHDFSHLSVGPRSMLGIGVGFGLRERLIVGADMWLGYAVDPVALGDGGASGNGQLFNINPVIPLGPGYTEVATLYRWTAQLAPYLELALGRGTVRPFVGVTALVAVQRVTYEWGREQAHQTALQFGYGLSGGAHVFLSDAISLDGSLRVSGAHQIITDDADQHATSIGIATIVGFSGWIR